jgi:hypothetical protein
MKETVIAEKVLIVQAATQNYDKLVSDGKMPKFPEKHYLAPGSIPAGTTTVKCQYIIVTKD